MPQAVADSKARHCDAFVVTCELQIRFHDFFYIHRRHRPANATVSDRWPRPMLSETNKYSITVAAPARIFASKQRTWSHNDTEVGLRGFRRICLPKDRSSKRKGRSLSTTTEVIL